MALTRKLLKSLGVSEDAVEAIIDAHTDTVSGLQARIGDLETQVQSITTITQERDSLRQQVEQLTANGGNAAEVQAAFDAYKQQVEGEKARTAKRTALDALLRDKVGVHRDEFRAVILDGMDPDAYQLDESGSLQDADTLAAQLGTKYQAFVGQVKQVGTKPITPPSSTGAPMSKQDIMAITDTPKRQVAIMQNLSAFGKE